MRILIVNTFYYPNMIGGTENSIRILAEKLYEYGNEVAIYSVDGEANNLKIEKINGVKVYRGHAGKYSTKLILNKNANKFKRLKNKMLELNNISAKKEFCKVIEDFKPDVIHTNNLYGISNLFWKIAKRKYNIPIIHTLRDYWMLYPIVSKEKLSKILFGPFMRSRTKYVDIVTAPSNYTLNKFIQNNYFKKSKKQCVPNAINIDMEESKKVIEVKYKNDSEKIRFMFVGMLTENKGLIKLLEAFSKIDNKDISLSIYGKGELKDLVLEKEKQDNRIKYYGQLKSEELKQEYIKNDVLIVPSIWEEPFGRVVIEGNQYGLPVIGADRAGILEILDNIHTGITYDYKSVDKLKQSIEYFIDRNNIKKYYNVILENINKYSVENQIEEFTKLYNLLVKKNERKENELKK